MLMRRLARRALVTHVGREEETLDEDSDCRVLLKADNDADAGTVEDMIKNSSLPLIIVYTGGSSALDAALAALPDQTFLFCTLLPAPNGPRTGP